MRVMIERYFLDTNIFVYSFDTKSGKKRSRAIALIEHALRERQGITSYQVVQEFLNVATRKFAAPMSAEDCAEYIVAVFQPLCTVFATLSLYELGLSIMAETQYTFFDALVVASAVSNACSVLYTEDMQAGRVIRGVTIRNPFV